VAGRLTDGQNCYSIVAELLAVVPKSRSLLVIIVNLFSLQILLNYFQHLQALYYQYFKACNINQHTIVNRKVLINRVISIVNNVGECEQYRHYRAVYAS
jgi:hypothetical protein